MATLHLLSHSPFSDTRLDSCLRLLGPGDGLLLCGDATYALQPASRHIRALAQLDEGIELFTLEEDMQARALQAGPVQVIDYPQFVALACRFDKVNSWL
ncbi:sulfurtransferase complex subunit TusB [Phytopseudomonas dryadis]|uniref:Sulfurtransferase complex subunit TusB n=1 Tax=Phytopseudomonas dryadis TaxID=2487520 RepID=A0ABY1ZE86_9GAMM|nr:MULTISPECIES: sulfurtransferase complex subunit TusB [Pseudomonas]TBV10064.1 sulfurtransferase complex subunit TusB [Pseudomonas dryadis]TBV19105.1 sulfurtransferase complex subunit TusB [Pseudomonas sp. FRB 230]